MWKVDPVVAVAGVLLRLVEACGAPLARWVGGTVSSRILFDVSKGQMSQIDAFQALLVAYKLYVGSTMAAGFLGALALWGARHGLAVILLWTGTVFFALFGAFGTLILVTGNRDRGGKRDYRVQRWGLELAVIVGTVGGYFVYEGNLPYV